MAHQPDLCGVEPGKQRGIGAYLHLCPAVFAGGAGSYFAAERPGEQLHTVAYAEHRYTYIEYGLVAVGGFLLVYAVGTAGMMPMGSISRILSKEISPGFTME